MLCTSFNKLGALFSIAYRKYCLHLGLFHSCQYKFSTTLSVDKTFVSLPIDDFFSEQVWMIQYLNARICWCIRNTIAWQTSRKCLSWDLAFFYSHYEKLGHMWRWGCRALKLNRNPCTEAVWKSKDPVKGEVAIELSVARPVAGLLAVCGFLSPPAMLLWWFRPRVYLKYHQDNVWRAQSCDVLGRLGFLSGCVF